MEADRSSQATRRRSHREPPPELTATELRVYAAVEDLSAELGFAPTLVQIAERIGYAPSSKGSVSRVIGALRRKGVVTGSGRSLRCLSGSGGRPQVPRA
jgi:CRP-like cAMP-binding protein